jgi:hypothetical protein
MIQRETWKATEYIEAEGLFVGFKKIRKSFRRGDIYIL